MHSYYKGRQRTLLVFSTVTVLLVLFWYPTIKCHFNALDEFCAFICFSKADDIKELLNIFLKPHNQHFAPVFKVIFFAEYKMFGISPGPYHAVSIGLFLLSAALLWKFIRKETGDNTAAAICSLAYATNTVYFTVVSWVFAQQIIFTFIFIELALICLQDIKGRLAIPGAALFCLSASLCLIYGGAAWLFCAIYLFFKTRKDRYGTGPPFRSGLKNYALLLISAFVTIILYASFSVDTSQEYGQIPLDPILYLHGAVIYLGNSLMKSLGAHSLAAAVSSLTGKDPHFLHSTLKLLSYLCFITAAIVLAAYFRKLSSNGKRLAAACFLIAGLSTLAIIGARASYFDLDVYRLVGVHRYTYFPMAFITIGIAPYITAMSRRGRLTVLLLLPLWVPLQILGLNNGIASQKYSIKVLDRSMSLARSSLDYPVEVDKSGNVYLTSILLKDSRRVENFKILPGQQISHVDIMRLFLGPDDLLAETGRSIFLLRHKRKLKSGDLKAISPNTAITWDGERAHISRDSEIALRLTDPPAGQDAQRQYVLSFKVKADQKGSGFVTCLTAGNTDHEMFNVSESLFFEAHQVSIPCQRYEDAVIVLQPGAYSLKDIRVYW